ncbi:MFS transporter [Kribbella sancticallisti]|uniref:MFS transporter n=1 Tax=Kribbella sancticallisti TaxID=460087 RepID=UPI0031DEC79A
MKRVTEETVGLSRYLLAAVLIRGANDGAAIGLVLLAVSVYGGVAAGGVLAGALTLPHVVGPLIGRLLDRGRDSRRTLALGFVTYAVALGSAAMLLGRAPLAVVVAVVLVAGCAGPLFGGGLSSRLSSRRAIALDTGTWGVATIAGPAAAGLLAVHAGPLTAVLILCATALASAVVTLTLPALETSGGGSKSRGVLRLFLGDRQLKRVAWCFVFAGLGTGIFPVAAPLLSTAVQHSPGSGGLLLTAYGAGSLIGSLLVAARPPTGPPLRRAGWCLAAMGLFLVGAAAAPEYELALVAFGLVGLVNGPFLAAAMEACRQNARRLTSVLRSSSPLRA